MLMKIQAKNSNGSFWFHDVPRKNSPLQQWGALLARGFFLVEQKAQILLVQDTKKNNEHKKTWRT